ncbi:tetratricopeptide repeat protein [Holosporaceae bacterium 'Namur']|nr:tetratricopeptide repeat protein [Holosporaceae bacterium 'Namur']
MYCKQDVQTKSVKESFESALVSKNYTAQVQILQNLGNLYLEKKEYTKATALYNTALVIVNNNQYEHLQEDIINSIQKIEESFLEDILCKQIPTLLLSYESNLHNKQYIEDLRKKVRNVLENIETEYRIGKEQNRNTRILELKKAERIRSLNKTITKDIKIFIRELVKECEDIIGKPPEDCKYAIIGLGSLSMGTITPYSDIEFLVLINQEKEEYKQYFRNLTRLLHIKVINLGETVLPTMVIEELNSAYSTDPLDDWFYDDITPNGFKFDGMMPRACKTPFGTTAPSGLKEGEIDHSGKKVFELIHIPEKMAEFQEEKWYEIDPLLPQELMHATLIAGEKELLNKYKEAITEKLKSKNSDGVTLGQLRSLAILIEDINRYNPYQLLNLGAEGDFFNVKKEIYRFIDRFIVALGDCFQISSKDNWDLIEKMFLKKAGNIGKDEAEVLKICLSIVTELRLRAYCIQDGQKEKLFAFKSPYITEEKENLESDLKEYFTLNDTEILYKFFSISTQIIHKLESGILLKNINLKGLSFNNVNNFIQGSVHLRLMNYKAAKYYFERHKDEQGEQSIDSKIIAWETLGHINLRLELFEEARSYYDRVLESLPPEKKSERALIMSQIAITCRACHKYDEAMQQAKKALKIMGNSQQAKLINLTYIFLNFGGICLSKGMFQDAKMIFKEAEQVVDNIPRNEQSRFKVNIYMGLGDAYDGLGDYKNAIEYYQKALKIVNVILSKQHSTYEILLSNLGGSYRRIGEFEKGIACYKESLNITRMVYGEECQTYALSLINLGDISLEQGYNRQAMKYYDTSKCILSTAHPKYNLLMISYGNLYFSQGNWQEAKNYYQQAIGSLEGKQHENYAELASAYNNLGNALCLGNDFIHAEEKYLKAKKINEQNGIVNHPSYANSIRGIATIHRANKEYEASIASLQEGINIIKKSLGKTHPDLAPFYDNIGNVYCDSGDFDKAIEYHNIALKVIINKLGVEHYLYVGSCSNLVATYYKAGQHDNAILMIKKVLRVTENIPLHTCRGQSLEVLGDIHSLRGRHEDAIDCFQKALIIYKDNEEVSYTISLKLAGAYFGNNKLNLAITEYEKILNKYGEHPYIYSSLGMIYYNYAELNFNNKNKEIAREYFFKAITAFEKACKEDNYDDPLYLHCLINLANIYSYQDNSEKAVKHINESINFLQNMYIEDSTIYYSNLQCISFAGVILARSNINSAIIMLEEVEKTFPLSRVNKHNLACLYHIQASNDKEISIKESYLNKAQKMFELADSIDSLELKSSSFYTEYAMFLIKHHNIVNQEGYEKIKELLKHAIELDNDNSGLLYSQIEKVSLVEVLQGILGEKENITINKPYILAYYLLIKVYKDHREIEKAKEELKIFATKVMDLKQQEAEIPLNLLIRSYEELGFKFQAKIYQEVLARTVGKIQEGLEK